MSCILLSLLSLLLPLCVSAQTSIIWTKTNQPSESVRQVRLHSTGVTVFDSAIFTSTNLGERWKKVKDPVGVRGYADVQFTSDSRMFATSKMDQYSGIESINITDDAGGFWWHRSVWVQWLWPSNGACLEIYKLRVLPTDSVLVSGTAYTRVGSDVFTNSGVYMASKLVPEWTKVSDQREYDCIDSSGALYTIIGNELVWNGRKTPAAHIRSLEASADGFAIGYSPKSPILYRMVKASGLIDSIVAPVSTPTKLVIAPRGQIFVISKTEGIFTSIDTGNSWLPVDQGLSTAGVLDISIRSGEPIFIVTSDGVYRSNIVLPGSWSRVAVSSDRSIGGVTLSGDIRMIDQGRQIESCTVYDMTGREVLRTSAKVQVDVSALPSGVYQLLLSFGGAMHSQRFVIAR